MPIASLHVMPAPNVTGNHLGVNLSFTRFLFVRPIEGDDNFRGRLRAIGAVIERGFYNAFELNGAHDAGPHETIQFLAPDEHDAGDARGDERPAPWVVHVSSKYRPRLDDVERELRRRSADFAEIVAIDGAVRGLQYTSAETHAWAYAQARDRASGRYLPIAIILPIRKSPAWWAMPSIERHQFFYPHHDRASGKCVPGHALVGREAAPHVCRRLFYNPDGTGRPGEWDFVTYFECADEHLEIFDATLAALRDPRQNPEWRYVEEGPLWKGRRVMRW